ncbi:hypothetical protein RhiJN_12001 [Ceratobasidium sp. AG-Ba]|nr:hypothetical protein RhiJN_12001 [Ceratobasidium sp. AG-Ba]
MRGRPSLRLLGTMNLCPNDVRLDTELTFDSLSIKVHPSQSYVTHQYFQNTLALASHTTYIPERTLLRSPHPHPHINPRITPTAVRIGLGDNVVVVYGRLQAEEYAKCQKGEMGRMELAVARIVDPGAVSESEDDRDEEKKKSPRADDSQTDGLVDACAQRQRSTTYGIVIVCFQTDYVCSWYDQTIARIWPCTQRSRRSRIRGTWDRARYTQARQVYQTQGSDEFCKGEGKQGKRKEQSEETDDPFTEEGLDAGTMLPKMMARVKSGAIGANAGGGEEAANKALIKRLAQSALDTYGLDKDDEGFKEVYGYVTRGVGFAFVVLFYAGLL